MPAPQAHGVTQRSAAATGSRTAWAWIASTSSSDGLSRTTDTAHANEARLAAPTPRQKRSCAAALGGAAVVTVRTRPPRVTADPAASWSVSRSPRNTAASSAEISG